MYFFGPVYFILFYFNEQNIDGQYYGWRVASDEKLEWGCLH